MSLSEQLNKLRISYETSEEIRASVDRAARIAATDYFLDKFIRTDEARAAFEKNATDAATFGKKLLQLETWSGRGPVYHNQSLSDLLDVGDLCDRMQDVFNQFYGEDEFRVFHYPIRNSRTTALTVSWDKSGFENADGIIRSNRLRAQQRLDSREHRDSDVENPNERPRRREHGREHDGGNDRYGGGNDRYGGGNRHYDQRDQRDVREPRGKYEPREQRQPFTPREPREQRQPFTPREPREQRQPFTPREPRQPFTPREPRPRATLEEPAPANQEVPEQTAEASQTQDTRQHLRPRRRVGGAPA